MRTKGSENILLEAAYNKALRLAKSHYENFPVVSFLIPGKLRKHVAIIYWFARTADDIADESEQSEGLKLEKLNELELNLKKSFREEIINEYFFALVHTIKECDLTVKYFSDLLCAFKQDVIKSKYKNYDELLSYCKHSANPVGRLILELFELRDETANKYSDDICTALQLTNFLQDTMIDYKKGRIYYPQVEMKKFDVTEKSFEQKENNDNFKQLVKFSVDRIQSLFDTGKKLLPMLKGSLKTEIGWTVAGGEEILEQIRKKDYDVINNRPKLSKFKMISIMMKSGFNF
jgi:squalene synthase HpnC